MMASAGLTSLAILLPTDCTFLLCGTYAVGDRYSSNRSITAVVCTSSQSTTSSGFSATSVSTTDRPVTSSSVCGAWRSKVVTAVPQ
ncbi:Uncharacterised protein [Mycobacteroides abscessus subsp. abscessus]|nr:Uncharacterised protein [Mycobacteroides abscessus subsp. abscessus]